MPTFNCVDCTTEIEQGPKGRPPLRCRPCAASHRLRQAAAWRARFKDREDEIPGRSRPREQTVAGRREAIQIRRAETQSAGCRTCGSVLTGSKTLYCSARCNWRAFEAKRKPECRDLHCKECEKPFTQTRPYQKFCTIACTRRARDRIYVARRRGRYVEGEKVDPMVVFARDGWRCQECRRRTPRALRGTLDPRAPELDHIVSVADGGEHSYRNTQCLCSECNGRKGRASRGQLSLL